MRSKAEIAAADVPTAEKADRANPDHRDISLNDGHRASIVPSAVSQTPLDEQDRSPGNYLHPNAGLS